MMVYMRRVDVDVDLLDVMARHWTWTRTRTDVLIPMLMEMTG